MIKKKYFIIFPCLLAISTSLFFVTTCSNSLSSVGNNTGQIKPEVPPKPEVIPPTPEVPPKPDVPIDVDNVLRTINVPYLQNVIKTNDFGYNPDSLEKTIYKYQKEDNQTFLENIFTDKKISNWASIKDLKIIKDDKLGTLSLNFAYGGTHNYKVDLTKDDGLLSDSSYYEKMDDLSFAFDVRYDSIVSGRTFPVQQGSTTLRDEGAMEKAGIIDRDSSKYGKVTTKGTWIDSSNNYVKYGSAGGTAWLVDYLPSNTPDTQDFYEFIVATNIHVADITDAFHYYNYNKYATNIQEGIALDPITIKTRWGRHSGELNYDDPNGFDQKNSVIDWSTFDNLSFQPDSYGTGDTNRVFRDKVIRDVNRMTTPDDKAFSSWDHPIGEKSINEKNRLLSDYNFYNPEYTALYSLDESYIGSSAWKEQLKTSDYKIQYNNIAPDLIFLKAQFKRKDLQEKWPKLLNAIDNNQMDSYLLPLKTTAMNPKDDISYYFAGYPLYTGETNSTQAKMEKDNGFDREKHKYGIYYSSAKTFPHLIANWGDELDFNVYPNNVDIDYFDDKQSIESKAGLQGIEIPGQGEFKDERLNLYWSWGDIQKKWSPYNERAVKEVLLQNVFVDAETNWVVDGLKWDPEIYTNKSSLSEYFASNTNRGMIKKTIKAAKKYYWGSSLYSLGGNSGSMAISPKMEIGGIFNATKPDYNVKNILIESFVQTSSNIIKGEKIIAHGISKILKDLNINSILYNKKNI